VIRDVSRLCMPNDLLISIKKRTKHDKKLRKENGLHKGLCDEMNVALSCTLFLVYESPVHS
jgi:hypothetical protein